MPVQSHGGGWRARKKHAGHWFMGPVRESVQLAEEDARKFDEASAVSLEALQEVQRNLASLESGPSGSRLVRFCCTSWQGMESNELAQTRGVALSLDCSTHFRCSAQTSASRC